MNKSNSIKDTKNQSTKLFSILTAVTFAAVSALGVAPFASQSASAAVTLQPCATTTTVKTTDLSTWDFSQTRSAGHYELVQDGLKIFTDTGITGVAGSPDPRKVAGYTATNFALSGLGTLTVDQALDYTATSGIEPGLQLVIDFNNDGSRDGLLVGESIYGDSWWLTNDSAQFVKDGAPNHSGGHGTLNHGTINEWLAVFPDARVQNIGFSLGSGVDGSGVINKISLGCTDYTFGLPPVRAETKEECKKDGWKIFTINYKNQGDCVSSVAKLQNSKSNPYR